MATIEVTIKYINKEQAKTIKNLLDYGLWTPAEVAWRKRPSTVSFELIGEERFTKRHAAEGRKSYKQQFEADGHKIESIKFREVKTI